MKRMKKMNRWISVFLCFALLMGMITLVNQGIHAAGGTALGNTGFVVQGGKEGKDYSIDESTKMVMILSGKGLTFSGTSSIYGIRVKPGVKADITLDNVTITAPLPIDVATNLTGTADGSVATKGEDILPENRTYLHLTLADGSTNKLEAGDLFPALHCGEGSILVIDDGVRNVDSNGNALTPVQGRVPKTCVLENGTKVNEGDPLYVMESKNPGKLFAYGGKSCAGIGSGIWENAGDMTFNGGYIEAYAYDKAVTSTSRDYDGTGAGIGSSMAGGCTVMTFNGGTIVATGSYHGAGVGTGLSSSWGPNWDRDPMVGTIQSRETYRNTIPRDIYINGGNLTAKGFEHGNAFGAGCAPGSNTGHKFVITGGNLIPITSMTSDIGGTGTDIIVTGGSFNTSKFSGTVTDGKGTELTMVKIDMSVYPEFKDKRIKGLNVLIDGKPLSPEYGLPNNIDAGNMVYFWLPKSVQGSDIEIENLVVVDESGKEWNSEYSYTLPNFSPSQPLAKQYIDFVLPREDMSEELAGLLIKQYDGLDIGGDEMKNEFAELKISARKPDGKYLNDVNHLTVSHQKLLDKDGNEVSEEVKEGSIKEVGSYQIILTSDEYAKEPTFQVQYWGHKVRMAARIDPADSVIKDFTYKLNEGDGKVKSVTFNAIVRPTDEMAKTCASPDGKIQFYANGVAIGEPVELTPQSDTKDGYHYSSVTYNWEVEGIQIPYIEGDKVQFTAKYYNGTNYNACEEKGTTFDNPVPGLPTARPPKVEIIPTNPTKPVKPLNPKDPMENKPGENPGDINTLHQKADDFVMVTVTNDTLDKTGVEKFIKDRYKITSQVAGTDVEFESIQVKDKDGKIVDTIDRSQAGEYYITTVVKDSLGNTTTVNLDYLITQPPIISVKPDEGGKPTPINPNNPPIFNDEDGTYHNTVNDTYKRAAENKQLSQKEVEEWIDSRYQFDNSFMSLVTIKDKDGNKVSSIDLSKTGNYIIETVVTDKYGNTTTVNTDYQIIAAPNVSIKPTDPDNDTIIPLSPDGKDIIDKDGHAHREYSDKITDTVEDKILSKDDIDQMILDRYQTPDGTKVTVKVFDKDKKEINQIDKSQPNEYSIEVTVEDDKGNTSTIYLDYVLESIPDINIDVDGDGKPDINIDTDGDGKPDINIDTDGDKKPDLNIDTNGDGKPDLNIDINGDGKPDINIDTNGDGKADLNVDINGDNKPDLNIDTDGDGIADKNIDKDGDGKVDVDIQGEDVKNDKKVKTGDNTSIIGFAVLAASSLFMIILLLSYKRRVIK